MKIELSVDVDSSRLDVYLAEHVAEQSRSRLQSMIRSGHVQVNGSLVRKPAHEVVSGDIIKLDIGEDEPLNVDLSPPAIKILDEDSEFLVLNKPPGMVVHPSHGHASGTLLDGVLAYSPQVEQLGEVGREGVVHRLDKDTSGVIIFAKTGNALDTLQELFKSRAVEKTYLALVDGAPPSAEGRIEAPLGRDARDRQRFSIRESGGREAVTVFKIQERLSLHSVIEAHPITGRTHQIRIHMSFIECPIVGDTVYGRKKPSLPVERQMLHAWKLKLPMREPFEAPIPADFAAAVKLARSQ